MRMETVGTSNIQRGWLPSRFAERSDIQDLGTKYMPSKTDERNPHLIHCSEMMNIKEKAQIRKDQEILRLTAQQQESERQWNNRFKEVR